MEQGIYMVPVRCVACNAVFDLWHTLQEEETVKKGGDIRRVLSQSLCGRCKNVLVNVGEPGTEDVSEGDGTEQTEEGELQLQLKYE